MGSSIAIEERIKNCVGILRVKEPARVAKVTAELGALVAKWQRVIRSAPVDIQNSQHNEPPSKRIRWLENNIEKTAKKLCDDLGNDSYFSTWGSFFPDELNFDRNQIRHDLQRLADYAEKLTEDLYAQRNERAPQTGEMRYEIVRNLVQFVRHYVPETLMVRGTYDKDSKYWSGSLPEFVAEAFAAITGEETADGKKLDNLLTLALKD